MPAQVRSPRILLLAAAAAALVLVLLAVVAFGGGGSSDGPPATDAIKLVPGDALVYVHISTDGGREANRRAGKIAAGFPGYRGLRNEVVGRLATTGGSVDFDRDVKPWLGKEAALALLSSESDTAGSLVLLDVADRKRAQAFVNRSSAGGPQSTYRGVSLRRSGAVVSAFIGHFLVIGQNASVRAAVDARDGRRPALGLDAVYRRAAKGMPESRVADAYASAEGVNRLLAPQNGVLGFVGTLLTNPALEGAALALIPESPGARLWEHSVLDGTKAKAGTSPFGAFEPALIGDVPDDAIAYLGITRLDRAISPLLSLAGSAGGSLGALLQQAGNAISKETGVNLERDVLPLFKGEVALAITPGVPTPILTVIARTRDEKATSAALARLQGPLAKLLAPAGAGPGAVPEFESHDVDGIKAYGVKLASTLEIDYAVFDGKVVISTGLNGIRAVKRGGGLDAADDFEDVLGKRPEKVTAVVFLDLNQLLDLAEQTGLSDSPSYARIRDDLRRVRAVGATTSVGEAESTAELRFKIP